MIDPDVARLVRGVLWPGFLGRTAPDWLLRELDGGLAGVVYFGQNLSSDPAEVAALSAELRDHRPEILIGVDEEGGNVSRLEAQTGSTLPGHAQLGALDDVETTRAVGAALAERLHAAGANVALAPVADVNTNPANPVIGVRSFGPTADLVSRHVAAMVDGLQAGGVAACVKHYPGHGDTASDSHLDLPRIDLDLAELEAEHLPPFDAAIAAGVASVMTAHIVVPAFGDAPATLNPIPLRRLRESGFDGVIISDALDMAAIRSTTGSGRGAVLALEAGVDLLCIGNPSNLGPKQGATTDEDDYLEVFEAVCAAVADGELDRAIVERAAARVAWLARSVSPSTGSGTGESVPEQSPAPERSTVPERSPVPERSTVPELVEGRFSDAIRRVVRVRGEVAITASAITLVDLRDRPTFAVASAHDPFAESLAERFDVTRLAAGPSLRTPGPDTEAPASDELTLLLETIPADDGVVLLADRLGHDTPQRLAVDRVALVRPDAVVVSVGLPLSEDAVLPLPVIDTLAASRASADRVTELLAAASSAAPTHHLHDQHHRNGS
ncbi:glycoside hydrolase family 3 protein [Plantibacter sp. VKM Ac-2885]|uniref:glycoside hydrolase family 3 protein n=1 Tax=Plantibacter sp. VKM Ac-2885 TaxID=2783828 RepID=UPI00188D1B46|nr:glycoside hydrolase family 3 N-terminal domain-containing protein [Plantibacter sp. VKM Ac-2885]MBF4513355.1 glycoside hydrolase family 3 protein [Plantibacter sp. VKM Ac-2885]